MTITTGITSNQLHGDPGIESHELHPQRSALIETEQQRDRARTIYEKSKPGRRAFVAPELDVPEDTDALPERFRRTEAPRLPEIAEPEINRHFNRISKRNFDLDTGFYPLGADYPEFEDGLLVAITEQRSRADIDRLVEVLGAAVAAERETVTA